MGFLRNLFGKRQPSPAWAEFFSPEEFEEFLGLVEQDLAGRGLSFRVDREAGMVAYRDGAETQQLGLLNLAQRCRQLSRGQWRETVHRHLDPLVLGGADTARFVDAMKADYSRAREFLRVRLQPEGFAQQLEAVVARPVAEGLQAALAFDLPDKVAFVQPSSVANWGVEADELFAIGLRNVQEAGRLPRQALDLPGGMQLELLEDEENFFAATHALLIRDYLDPAPELGALVSMPHRHAVLLFPVRDASVRRGLANLAYLTAGLHKQGPGSISPNVYWWDGDRLHLIPSEETEDGYRFSYPDLFVTGVLERLDTE